MMKRKAKDEIRPEPTLDEAKVANPEPQDAQEEASLEPDEVIAELQAQRDEFNAKYLHALADLQNFRKRAAQNEQEARQWGARSVVQSILTVMDHFDLALAQDPQTTNAQQILSGVEVVRDELLMALKSQRVDVISPKPNDIFDPNLHEAVMYQPQEGISPGHIVAMLQLGYTLADRVVRPAKVSLAPAEQEPAASEE